jgi:hypothetical protein
MSVQIQSNAVTGDGSTTDSSDREDTVETLRALVDRYPNLAHIFGVEALRLHGPVDGRLSLQRDVFIRRHCRVRLIQLPYSDETTREFSTFRELDHFLLTPPPAQSRRIFVVENVDLSHIVSFQRHFQMDPTVFASQMRTTTWVANPHDNNTQKLLLSRDPLQTFTLRYGELREFAESIAGLQLTESRAGRKIFGVKRSPGALTAFSKVGLVRRCISFWCRESNGGASYDGICH